VSQKESVLDAISELPDEVSFQKIVEKIEFLAAIQNPEIPVMSLKKTPATRGNRRGRLDEFGLVKISVEVEQVEELERVELAAQNNPRSVDRCYNYQAYWRR